VAAAHPSYPLRVAVARASLRLSCARIAYIPPILLRRTRFSREPTKCARTRTSVSPLSLPSTTQETRRCPYAAAPAQNDCIPRFCEQRLWQTWLIVARLSPFASRANGWKAPLENSPALAGLEFTVKRSESPQVPKVYTKSQGMLILRPQHAEGNLTN
jgi:hypothetical protein